MMILFRVKGICSEDNYSGCVIDIRKLFFDQGGTSMRALIVCLPEVGGVQEHLCRYENCIL